jgi:hypothetical protein
MLVSLWVSDSFAGKILASEQATQQGVQPTSGTQRVFCACSWLWIFSGSRAESTPAHLQLTPAVGQHLKD